RCSPPTASMPQRVVSFINVVGCGTLPSIGIRQNRRQVIESLTSRHKLSYPKGVAELQKHHPQVGFHRRRWPAHPMVKERQERYEEHRVVQQRVDPGKLLRKPQHLRRQHRLPQTHIPSSRPKHHYLPRAHTSHRDHDLVIRSTRNGDTPSQNPRAARKNATTVSGRSS